MSWVIAALDEERKFVEERLPQLGLTGHINPDKQFDPYAPDLIVEGLLSDLKSQHTPFFKAGEIYGIDPQYAVSFNLKDDVRYSEKYSDVVVIFDVAWKTTEMTIRGETFHVDPIRRTYAGYLGHVKRVVKECGNHRHNYMRRYDDTKGNAKDSWILDARKLELLDPQEET
jgi:hypothetical protein